MKEKIKNIVTPLYNKVWHSPKGKIRERIKKACDDLPRNQRLMVVTVLLSAFILTAFFVFGNACYRMGAGHARKSIEIEHIRQLDLPTDKAVEYEDAR
ncbi:TraL conjugative transposon family protein [Xylanibacter rodentium]|uniref:TraL conjugative transposon family protein n=1 Tax=Xylanibacter rodentium TaxID=2736289 RepID=UPI002585AFF9|nr:TraL conjugative transposon family protein [Xylanibacter rodentium]